MIKVNWPSQNATRAEAWRVLDLSGMTDNVRQSRNFTKAGYLFVNGDRLQTLRDTVEIGRVLRFELRFPNGVTKMQIIMLVRPVLYKARLNQPDTRYHKA